MYITTGDPSLRHGTARFFFFNIVYFILFSSRSRLVSSRTSRVVRSRCWSRVCVTCTHVPFGVLCALRPGIVAGGEGLIGVRLRACMISSAPPPPARLIICVGDCLVWTGAHAIRGRAVQGGAAEGEARADGEYVEAFLFWDLRGWMGGCVGGCLWCFVPVAW